MNRPVRKPVTKSARKKSRKKSRSKTEERELVSVNSESEVVRVRLARIESNYALLDQMLTDLETRVPDEPHAPSLDSTPRKPR